MKRLLTRFFCLTLLCLPLPASADSSLVTTFTNEALKVQERNDAGFALWKKPQQLSAEELQAVIAMATNETYTGGKAYLRNLATKLLGAQENSSYRSQIESALLKVADASDKHLSWEAIRTLREYGHQSEAIYATLRKKLEDSDADVRSIATRAIVQYSQKGQDYIDIILNNATTHESHKVRYETFKYARALAEKAPTVFANRADSLIKGMSDENTTVKVFATYLAGDLAKEGVFPLHTAKNALQANLQSGEKYLIRITLHTLFFLSPEERREYFPILEQVKAQTSDDQTRKLAEKLLAGG
jgi:hypothetical protein